MAQKKYDNAIQEFEQALKKSTDTLQPLSSIISANLAQKKPERAVERLAGILKETPNHPFAHELLAEVYIIKKQYPDAEKELREAIKANPKWNTPYRNLANLYLVRGNFPAAEEVYQQGLQAIPDDGQLLLHLAETYERTRDFTKAIATYDRILQKNPSFEIATNNLASLLTDQKGDADSLNRAKALAQRFELSPQPAFRDTLGWVYYKSGETDKAVALLEGVVKQAPAISIFQYHLGMAYHKKGNATAAKTHLTKALEGKANFGGADEARAVLKQLP
jgi:tetratricopeptide (TPR) repeat protein